VPDRGTLYLCATPIGNLEDITFRALRVLKEADVIAAEDTRHAAKLLSHYGIETPIVSFHEHNEDERAHELVRRLLAGENVALISDAGTPAISDPGFALVRLAVEKGIAVVAVPGPSAFLAALVSSGLPPYPFYFGGFLPRKRAERRRLLESLASLEATLVFYESPHRIDATLEDVAHVFPDRKVAVARELTKKFEEIVRGDAQDVRRRFAGSQAKGEFVVLIGGAAQGKREEPSCAQIERAIIDALREGKSKREAALSVASLLGVSRKTAYDLAIQLSKPDTPDPPEP